MWAVCRQLQDEADHLVTAETRTERFYGWRVVHAAFVLGVFGWGIGFYGPSVFLSVIREERGWPLALLSTAVSVHFLVGAVTGANLPAFYRRLGAASVTKAGALSMASGIVGWATAASPWHLFVSAALSGMGWGMMGAAALNEIVSTWFVRARPAALAMAYNGGSVGGIIFSPLWVAAISVLGFPAAASAVGVLMAVTMWMLADLVFSRTPELMGLRPDGDEPGAPAASITSPAARTLPGSLLWCDRKFLTLSAGMALGLFAQAGLTVHLFSLLAFTFGAQQAGLAIGLVTVMAIAGRTLLGWLMPLGADRRLVACGGYAAQIAGSIAFILAAGTSVPLLLVGVVLFGAGFGNATSLPPLIAQVEFVKDDVPRVAALIVAIAQGGYAFAPAFFGLIREFTSQATDIASGEAPAFFAVAALIQGLAVGAFLAGRRR
jgi:MFS family permease